VVLACFTLFYPRYRTVGVTIEPSRACARRWSQRVRPPYPSGLNRRPFLSRAVLTRYLGRSPGRADSETWPLTRGGGQGEVFPGRV
jgi:hypothetical protein